MIGCFSCTIKNTTPRNGRPPDKREQVLSFIRSRIVAGSLLPGARVPTHQELERLCRADSRTIRAAMEELREAGFIETRHRCGTFVVPYPPHLSNFGFVFPFGATQTTSQFFHAIRREAERWQSAERQVLPFYEVDFHVDTPDHQRLIRCVLGSRLAGVVFAFSPMGRRALELLLAQACDLPHVAIAAQSVHNEFPTVYPDLDGFLPKAFERLAACGCKRAAVVMLSGWHYGREVERIPSLATACGLTVEPHWIQAASPESGLSMRRLARLLVCGVPGVRPDGLVITDDNLVPELTAGLAESGVPVRAAGEAGRPGDLVVVAQTNFPHPTQSAVPVMRLGYDISKLVAVCMDRIAQQRRGESPATHTAIPAIWEEEVGH